MAGVAPQLLAEAALYLACKLEECPRRMGDVINVVQSLQLPAAARAPPLSGSACTGRLRAPRLPAALCRDTSPKSERARAQPCPTPGPEQAACSLQDAPGPARPHPADIAPEPIAGDAYYAVSLAHACPTGGVCQCQPGAAQRQG